MDVLSWGIAGNVGGGLNRLLLGSSPYINSLSKYAFTFCCGSLLLA
ncbi:hypothetical protein [Borreliella andersonii]